MKKKENPTKPRSLGELKGIKNKRQGEIYSYFHRQLYQEKNQDSLENLSKQKRDYLVSSLYKSEKLTKTEHRQILRQTNQAYREEIADQTRQLRYYKDKIGSKNKSLKEFLKKEEFKYFWLEKGEHKKFRDKKKEFETERQQILSQIKGKRIKKKEELLNFYQRLYQKSPWRIRDRFLTTTSHKGESQGMEQIWRKYIEDNPFPQTKKHYLKAITGWLNSTQKEGEPVPDSEIEFDKYGKPRLKAGQWIAFTGRPGRSWSVYKNVPSWKEQEKRKIHDVAHSEYIEEYGSEMEKQVWRQKKNLALCWIEATYGYSCQGTQGSSSEFCLDCVLYGEYHPPTLPQHCPWLYTYKKKQCGNRTHGDANLQYHFSWQGRRTLTAGKDWGTCHIGRFSKPRKSKPRKK